MFLRSLVLALCLAPVTSPPEDTLVLVESVPTETSLGSEDLPDTHEVWTELVTGATESIDLASFYVSGREGSRLEDVWRALEAAAERGVRVRFLTDERFYETYPASFDRLTAAPGIEHRRYDMRADTGGVMHAKYLVVDGRRTYLGSANFDWRSLEHIQELGLVLDSPELAAAYAWTFAHDWALAGGEEPPAWDPRAAPTYPVELVHAGETVRVTPAIAPTGRLGDEAWFDLPRLVAWIDTARERVRAQVMTYRTIGYDGDHWDALEAALRRAAARGVDVRLQVADWGKREGTVEGLQSLACLSGIDVHFVTIPAHSGGHVPYGRVAHSKFLVVDGRRAWVGSSNWSRGYFHSGRNVGAFVEGRSVAARLERFHDELWGSDLSYPVEPGATYEAPRVGD